MPSDGEERRGDDGDGDGDGEAMTGSSGVVAAIDQREVLLSETVPLSVILPLSAQSFYRNSAV